MFPDELTERNRAWADGREAEPLPPVEAVRLAVVACYDPRLDPLLRPALGLEEGQGFLFRAAGARVTPTGGTLRSLAMAVYMFDVREILVLGHSSCRMAAFDTRQFSDAFRGRGVARAAFGDQDLRAWAGAIANPRQGVIESAGAIASAPFLPRDLAIAGGVLDDTTGRIEVVLRPGEPIPGALIDAAPRPEERAEEEPREPAAGTGPSAAPPPPPGTPPPEVPAALRPVYEAVDFLSSQSQMYAHLAELRRRLRQETNPLRQLGLIQEFVKTGAAETRELRQAFHHFRQEIGDQQFLSQVLLPLLQKVMR